MPQTDMIVTLLFGLMLAQLCWFSVVLARRGLFASLILRANYPLIGIWVLLWPMYEETRLVPAGIMLMVLALILAMTVNRPFFTTLRRAWCEEGEYPWAMTMFILSLAITAGVFTDYPAFGFGAALSLCLALPLSQWLDRAGIMRLGFAANPQQTLPSHLSLIIAIIIACGWSLHVYRQIGWMESFTATALAGLAASAAVALVAAPYNMPLMVTAIAGVLWAL